jgi:hypothetical protein
MWCPRCGAANDDGARFCSSCGTDMGSSGQQQGAGGQPPTYQQPYQQTYQQPYQQQYQQPYQAPRYASGPGYGAVPHVPSYMGWAIVVLILCFWPTGIAAVVNASRVGNMLALGNIAGAQESSRKAKMWCWITFGIGVAWAIIVSLVWYFYWRTAVGLYDLNHLF